MSTTAGLYFRASSCFKLSSELQSGTAGADGAVRNGGGVCSRSADEEGISVFAIIVEELTFGSTPLRSLNRVPKHRYHLCSAPCREPNLQLANESRGSAVLLWPRCGQWRLVNGGGISIHSTTSR